MRKSGSSSFTAARIEIARTTEMIMPGLLWKRHNNLGAGLAMMLRILVWIKCFVEMRINKDKQNERASATSDHDRQSDAFFPAVDGVN